MSDSKTKLSPCEEFLQAARNLATCFVGVKSLSNLTAAPEELQQRHRSLLSTYNEFLEAFNAFRMQDLFKLYLDMREEQRALRDRYDRERTGDSGSDERKRSDRTRMSIELLRRSELLVQLSTTYGNDVYSAPIIKPPEPFSWLSMLSDAMIEWAIEA